MVRDSEFFVLVSCVKEQMIDRFLIARKKRNDVQLFCLTIIFKATY
jgi:hypothetical protein